MIRVYRLNTGSCGGCDVEIMAAVAADPQLSWAATPADADLLLLTGPLTLRSRPFVQAILAQCAAIPLLAIGRCAIDGHPFGRGGLAEVPEVVAQVQLDGCPPTVSQIVGAIRSLAER